MLRISFTKQNKHKLNISTPEFQFNDSYMKKRVQKEPKPKRIEAKSDLKPSDPNELEVKVSDKSYDGDDKENEFNLETNDKVISEQHNE